MNPLLRKSRRAMLRGRPCLRPARANQEDALATIIALPSFSLPYVTEGNTENHRGLLGQAIDTEGASERVHGVLSIYEDQCVATSNRADRNAKSETVTL
jgi:hypothetical protein